MTVFGDRPFPVPPAWGVPVITTDDGDGAELSGAAGGWYTPEVGA